MFGDELIIGSVRAQAVRLKEILSQIEEDQKWKEHIQHYAQEIYYIERNLRKIRKTGFEHMHRCS